MFYSNWRTCHLIRNWQFPTKAHQIWNNPHTKYLIVTYWFIFRQISLSYLWTLKCVHCAMIWLIWCFYDVVIFTTNNLHFHSRWENYENYQESHRVLREKRKNEERKEIGNRDTCYSSGSFHLLEYDMPCVSIDGIYLDKDITK